MELTSLYLVLDGPFLCFYLRMKEQLFLLLS